MQMGFNDAMYRARPASVDELRASILPRFYYAAAACGGLVSQLWRAGSGLR